MKKKIIISAVLLSTLFFSGVRNNPAKEVKANSSVVTSSEVVETITNEYENVELTEEQVEKIVKEISNKVLGEELTDKLFGMFGIGLGIIVLIYIAFQVNERVKNNQLGKLLLSNNKESNDQNVKTLNEIKENLKEYENLVNKLRNENESLINQNNAYVKEITKLAKKTHDDLSKVTEGLNKYKNLESKIDAIIKIESELMKKPSNVTNGISEKVNEIIKGVINNEEN